jgi:uncharacterized protein (DUF1778 family)
VIIVPNKKQTSKDVVSTASKFLRDGRYKDVARSVAGSALSQTKKEERLSLRVSSSQKEVLEKAAEIKQTSLTNFVLDNSFAAAQEILANQVRFVLSEEQWNKFNEILEAPAKEIPALKNLFSKGSVFNV